MQETDANHFYGANRHRSADHKERKELALATGGVQVVPMTPVAIKKRSAGGVRMTVFGLRLTQDLWRDSR